MDCHDRHDCNGNCNTYLPPSARLLHRSVLYRTFSRASRHRATLHLVLVEEQITPDSPIPILCRLRQSADRLALYPFRLIAIPRQFPSHAVALGPYPHRHLPSLVHHPLYHLGTAMHCPLVCPVSPMMNKRMGEQEEHSTRRNLHRPGLQLGRSGTAHTRRLASTHRMQLLLRRMWRQTLARHTCQTSIPFRLLFGIPAWTAILLSWSGQYFLLVAGERPFLPRGRWIFLFVMKCLPQSADDTTKG